MKRGSWAGAFAIMGAAGALAWLAGNGLWWVALAAWGLTKGAMPQ
jgi:hypothetical protein